MLRITPSDITALYIPSRCDLRVWFRTQNWTSRADTAYEEVLRRLGERHETAHLQSIQSCTPIDTKSEDERVRLTQDLIKNKCPAIYQPAFRIVHKVHAEDIEIFGVPDFLLLDDGGYIVRDAKMARRVNDEAHPEIILQLQLYGWLYQMTCGVPAKALQVYSGKKEIVEVPDDRGVAALAEVARVVALKKSSQRFYEPVGWSKCNPCEFHQTCWNEAEKKNDVALIPDVDQGLARRLHEMNIHTPESLLKTLDEQTLSDLKRPSGTGEKRVGIKAKQILLFAEVFTEGKERILGIPKIPPSNNYVMFDLEGMPPHLDELDKIYLWGTQVFGKSPGEFRPAVAEFGDDGDIKSWFGFLAIANDVFTQHGDIPFVHWAPYEKTHVKKYIDRYGDPDGTGARVLANLFDLLTTARTSVALPLPSRSLKVIEQHVGYVRKQNEFGGQWSMAMFIEATETSDQLVRAKLIDQILAYNREDLDAMWAVFEWLRAMIPQS